MERRRFFRESGKAVCVCAMTGGLGAAIAGDASAGDNQRGRRSLPQVAYCGLYCGSCPLYLMSIAEGDSQKQQCLGCKGDKLAPHCQKCAMRDCAKEKGVKACGECQSFPCEKTKGFHKGMGPMGQVAERNSVGIQAIGLTPLWSRLQQCRWMCEKCGKEFSIKDEKCPKCGADVYSGAEEAADYGKLRKK